MATIKQVNTISTDTGVSIDQFTDEQGQPHFEFWIDYQNEDAGWGIDGELTTLQQYRIASAISDAYKLGQRVGADDMRRSIRQTLGM